MGPNPWAATRHQIKRASPTIGIRIIFTENIHRSFETWMYKNGRDAIQKRKKQRRSTEVMFALAGSRFGIRLGRDGQIARSI
jgi:hypothetical protein